MEGFEHPELLGDDERLMVRQHHAAGAHADRAGDARQVRDQDGRRRARDPGHVVMLCDPVAPVAEALGVLRELERVPQRPAGVGAGRDGCEIEDGERGGAERDHAAEYGDALPSRAADPNGHRGRH